MKRGVWVLFGVVACIVVAGVAYMSLRSAPSSLVAAVKSRSSDFGDRFPAPPSGAGSHLTRQYTRDTSDVSHWYSPLLDPPPTPTSEQLEEWNEKLWTQLVQGLQPDLSGPPWRVLYARLSRSALAGNVEDATRLYKGFEYCLRGGTWSEAGTPAELQQTIERMESTGRDGFYNAPLDNVGEAVNQLRVRSRFCGPKFAAGSVISQLANVALRGNDPEVKAYAWNTLNLPGPQPTTVTQFQHEQQQMWHEEDNLRYQAGLAGVPVAWLENSDDQGLYGNSTQAYAYLYVAYMLTRSDLLEWKLWKRSQSLTPLQVAAGEQQAHEIYGLIKPSG